MVAVIIAVNKSLVICEDLTSFLEEKAEYSLHLQQDFMCNSSKYQQDINSARILYTPNCFLEISHMVKQ